GEDRFHRLDIRYRLVLINLPNCVSNRRSQTGRIDVGLDYQIPRIKEPELQVRQIGLWFWIRSQLNLPHVPGDANDIDPILIRFNLSNAKAFPDRIFVRPEGTRHRFTNHRDSRSCNYVLIAEFSSAQNRNGHCVEISGTDNPGNDYRLLRGWQLRPALDANRHRVALVI